MASTTDSATHAAEQREHHPDDEQDETKSLQDGDLGNNAQEDQNDAQDDHVVSFTVELRVNAVFGNGSFDVEVDAKQNKWPENDCQNCGKNVANRIQMR